MQLLAGSGEGGQRFLVQTASGGGPRGQPAHPDAIGFGAMLGGQLGQRLEALLRLGVTAGETEAHSQIETMVEAQPRGLARGDGGLRPAQILDRVLEAADFGKEGSPLNLEDRHFRSAEDGPRPVEEAEAVAQPPLGAPQQSLQAHHAGIVERAGMAESTVQPEIRGAFEPLLRLRQIAQGAQRVREMRPGEPLQPGAPARVVAGENGDAEGDLRELERLVPPAVGSGPGALIAEQLSQGPALEIGLLLDQGRLLAERQEPQPFPAPACVAAVRLKDVVVRLSRRQDPGAPRQRGPRLRVTLSI